MSIRNLIINSIEPWKDLYVESINALATIFNNANFTGTLGINTSTITVVNGGLLDMFSTTYQLLAGPGGLSLTTNSGTIAIESTTSNVDITGNTVNINCTTGLTLDSPAITTTQLVDGALVADSLGLLSVLPLLNPPYTPTISNLVNLSVLNVLTSFYYKVGNIVTGCIQFSGLLIAGGGALTRFEFTLPESIFAVNTIGSYTVVNNSGSNDPGYAVNITATNAEAIWYTSGAGLGTGVTGLLQFSYTV